MRGAAGLQMREPERFLRYVDVMFRAMWVAAAATWATPPWSRRRLQNAGFDAAAFSALVGDPEVKAKLIAITEEAVRRGVFGAPTMFVGEQMFFGQDRLEFVKDALRAAPQQAS